MATKDKAKSLLNKMFKGRPQPQSPRSGYLASGRKYGCGGKVKTGKNS